MHKYVIISLFIFVFMFILSNPVISDPPPEGVISLVEEGIDYSGPLNYPEGRHVVVHPTTTGSPTPWVSWETGSAGDKEIYSKYYNAESETWIGSFQISQSATDAGRPAMCITSNGRIHCVYHGQHDSTGEYELGYAWHSGEANMEWNWVEVLTDNFGPYDSTQDLFPTIVSDNENGLWVCFIDAWSTIDESLWVMHGVWNEDGEEMIWQDPEFVSSSQTDWLYGSMDVDSNGNLHIAYNAYNDLYYRMRFADGTWSEEEFLDSHESGEVDMPSMVVDSCDEVHIIYSFTWGLSMERTPYYKHGNMENWSDRLSIIDYNEGIYDTVIVQDFPIVGIDGNDDLWVVFPLWIYDEEWENNLDYDLLLYHKPYGEDWESPINYMSGNDDFGFFDIRNSALDKHIGSTGPGLIFNAPEGIPKDVYFMDGPNVTTGIKMTQEVDNLPGNAFLYQNYPNPFNPTTTISFNVPDGIPKAVSLRIYNLSGELVKTLINKAMEPGYHSVMWNGRDDSGRKVSSGVYIYKFSTSKFCKEKKCVILK